MRLGLDRPVHEALAEYPALLAGTSGCRVLRALARKEEMADLLVSEATRVIVVRRRPEFLVDSSAVRERLRRELLHVADMLDPAVGYEKDLPASELGICPQCADVYAARARGLDVRSG